MATTAPKAPLPLPIVGMRPDLDSFLVPENAVVDSRNWIFRAGKLQVSPGLTQTGGDLQGTGVYGFATYPNTDSSLYPTLLAASQDDLEYYNPTTNLWTSLTDIGGDALLNTIGVQVVFRIFQKSGTNYLLFCNGKGDPQKWNGNLATGHSDIGGSPGFYKLMCIVADRLLLANKSGGERLVDVSNFQDFDTGWGAVETAILSDTPGEIRAMWELSASAAAIYKSDAIYIASGTTGLTPIRFDLAYANIDGPMSQYSVVPTPSGSHIFLGSDGGLYTFNGTTLTEHVLSTMTRELYRTLVSSSLTGRRMIHGVYLPSYNELRFYLPKGTGGFPDMAIVINMTNNSLWLEDYDPIRLTASLFIRKPALISTSSPQVLVLGRRGTALAQAAFQEGGTYLGNAIEHYLETGMTSLGDQTRYKHVAEIEHAFAPSGSTQTVSVQLNVSKSGETPTLTTARTLSIGAATAGPYTTSHRVDARFLGLKISGTATDVLQWRGSSAGVIARGPR